MRTFLEHADLATIRKVALNAPKGWQVAIGQAGANAGGFRRETPTATARYHVTAPADAALTEPYFLLKPRNGSLYDWPADAPQGMPFAPPLMSASVTFNISGTELTLVRPVRYRYADRVRGELRRDLNVVPELSVGFDSDLLVVPTAGAPQGQRLVVTATSFVDRSVTGTLRLRLPAGWTSSPVSAPFSVTSAGDSATATFVVTPPARRTAGVVIVSAEAAVGSRVFSSTVETVSYPHIQNHRLYSPAAARVEVIDLAVAPVRVGYIMGSGDEVPDALRRMGVDVTMIDREMLTTGDLSRFDTIVVGVRASEARPDFLANQARLRTYMERGGTLVVQYQQTDYVDRNLPPYPVKSPGNSRVTDETAAVRILAPTHPVFTFPNRITSADFDGWVQERNLYSFGSFDARYTRAVGVCRSGRGATARRRSHRGCWQREIRLHVLRVVPTAARRSPGRVPAVRESDQPAEGAVEDACRHGSVGTGRWARAPSRADRFVRERDVVACQWHRRAHRPGSEASLETTSPGLSRPRLRPLASAPACLPTAGPEGQT